MLAILTSVELWIGLALLMGIPAVFMHGGEKKRKALARMQRITRRGPSMRIPLHTESSLRRARPEETAFGQFLLNFSSIEKLRSRMEIAGYTMRPQRFLLLSSGCGIVVILLVITAGKSPLLALLLGLIVGFGGPHFQLSRRIKKRQQHFLKLFPEAIDLIVRGLRAGLPVAEAFQTISKEIPAPVGTTFATISQQVALGIPLERALAETAKRLGMTEFNFFTTTIILQRETGGNLGEILTNLSEVLRQRQVMKLKIGALSSEARASAMIVGALPFVVFMLLQIVSPHYLIPLFEDYRGNMALIGAGLSMLVGGFIMKRMTELEI